ncbi:MAG: multiheme c-type cytochrome, partial [bacterium]|nr:multiheme c-type cytochrome [bacterium]
MPLHLAAPINAKLKPPNQQLRGAVTSAVVIMTLFVSCGQKIPPDGDGQTHPQGSPGQTLPKESGGQTVSSPVRQTVPRDSTYSNIRSEDYVGPGACAECHQKNFANWQKHPHSRMNMLATEETVLGDFSRATLSYGSRKAVFRKQNNQFLVEYFQEEQLLRQFQITRVIGWRYEQDYVGTQIHGPEPAGDPIYKEEIRLGFAYAIDKQQWFPQSYLEPSEYAGSEYKSDGSLRHDPFVPTPVAFNRRCARCHNTYPYDLRLYRIYTPDGMLSGFPPGPGLEPGVVADLAAEAGDTALLGTDRLPIDRFVTVGISCESCHFGGREHARFAKEIRFVPTHPLLAKWTPDY